MGYLYLLCVAFMFSLVGTCVKTISPYFTPDFITFFRFFFGIGFLIILKFLTTRSLKFDFSALKTRNILFWVLFGGVVKWLAYIVENIALTRGSSYGNIVLQPSQTISITVISVILFKEKFTFKKLICILACMIGVLCISWNGKPLEEFLANIALSGMYVACGIFAACHVLSQKKIGENMDIIDSNIAIFAVSGLICGIPLIPKVAAGQLSGLDLGALEIIMVLGIGFFTGIGFYLNAKAIPLVPFFMVPILQSTMVFFALFWGMLFFDEKITAYVIGGTILFVAGLIGLNLSNAKPKKAED